MSRGDRGLCKLPVFIPFKTCWGWWTLFGDELIGFLRDNFPAELGEINAAMGLLAESVDNAAGAVAAKGNKLSLDKEFKNASELLSKADELQTVSKEIAMYTETLELEGMAIVSEDDAIEDIEKSYPNYGDYEVDINKAHALQENYVHKRPHAFELRGQKIYVTNWKEMLVETCNILAEINPDLINNFPKNPRFNGRKSQYFRLNDPGLMRSPFKLDYLDMYVETNFSANAIRNLIIKMIKHYRIPTMEYKIFLRADYTGLHPITGNYKPSDVKLGAKEENKQILQETSVFMDKNISIQNISNYLRKPLFKHTGTIYRSRDLATTVICLFSSARDSERSAEFWFGLRVKQKEALEECKESYLTCICGSANKIILIPYTIVSNWLTGMSISYKAQEIEHWNIIILEEKGKYTLRLKGDRQNIDLAKYVLPEL